MVYVNEKTKIVHLEKCHFAKKSNFKTLNFLQDALKRGYRLCKKCNLIYKLYLKEYSRLENYAKQNLLTFTLCPNYIKVSSINEQWKIALNENCKEISLYHKNSQGKFYDNYIPNYHLQNTTSESILGYFKYIFSHAKYVNNSSDTRADKKFFNNKSNSNLYRNSKRNSKKSKKNKKENNTQSIIELFKSLHKEEDYKDFLCYLT